MKQVLYEYVPESFFDRPKRGFAIPLNLWLGGELSYLIHDYLSDKVIEECNLVRLEYVKDLKNAFASGRNYLYNRLWLLIILHKWYKEKHL